jgi:hypothetical protein
LSVGFDENFAVARVRIHEVTDLTSHAIGVKVLVDRRIELDAAVGGFELMGHAFEVILGKDNKVLRVVVAALLRCGNGVESVSCSSIRALDRGDVALEVRPLVNLQAEPLVLRSIGHD